MHTISFLSPAGDTIETQYLTRADIEARVYSLARIICKVGDNAPAAAFFEAERDALRAYLG